MIENEISPFPILETQRLILRKPEMSDDENSFFLRNDDATNKYLEWFRHTDITQTRAFLKKLMDSIENDGALYWIMTLKNTGQFVGTICIWNVSVDGETAEIGYTIHPDHSGKGYMHEALEKVIDHAFGVVKLKTIEARTHRDNASSTRLLQKSGFVQNHDKKAEDADNIVFELEQQKRRTLKPAL